MSDKGFNAKFSFIWNFHDKKVCSISLNFFRYFKYDYVKKNRNVNFSTSNKQFSHYWI